MLALRLPTDGVPPRPEAVRTPRDHLLLHRDPARRPDHEFLYASGEQIALGEIATGVGRDLDARLADLGHPPLTADLTVPVCRPFRVVRALAPGLVPMVFGWAQEPLGLARVRDGAGEDVHTDTLPHPLP